MKVLRLFLLSFILFLSVTIFAQERKEIEIPDIPGFYTLKCDFHMHTVFPMEMCGQQSG